MRDIIKEIGLDEYKENIKNVDNKEEYTEAYLEKVYEFLKNEDISVCVVVLDLLFNYHPSWSWYLLSSRDEKLLRAQLVLEKLKRNDIFDIKKDIEKVKESDSSNWKYDKHRTFSKRQLEFLNEYLNNSFNEEDNEQIEEMVSKDLVLFLKELENFHETFFSLKCRFPSREIYIESMFDEVTLDIDVELLNHIFNEILEKNKNTKNYNYTNIIIFNLTLLGKIKGLYKKATDFVYDDIVSTLIKEKYSEKKYFDIGIENILKEILEKNKDDRVSIVHFFNEIKKRLNIFQRYRLEKKVNFKDLKKVNINDLCQENLEKLLNDSADINEDILEELGRYPKFLDQYDKFLEKFFYSTDINYQRKLIKPLIVGLIEKLKENYKLDFVYYVSAQNYNCEYGHYDSLNNSLHINSIFCENNDLYETFVSYVVTVFHEVRHAIQFKEIKINKKFDYKNLIMSMERTLQFLDLFSNNYYHDNYLNISYEYDAREMAYVDTMIFFRNLPNFQRKFQEVAKNNIMGIIGIEEKFNSYYIKKDNNGNFKGIIDVFLEKINSSLSSEIKNVVTDIKECDWAISGLINYPVIENFFDIDLNNRKITIKSEEYFENKLKEFESMPECQEKREGIYSIKAFMHALKIGKYLEEREESLVAPKYEEVIENVGEAPSR